jgi:hypothetical protein
VVGVGGTGVLVGVGAVCWWASRCVGGRGTGVSVGVGVRWDRYWVFVLLVSNLPVLFQRNSYYFLRSVVQFERIQPC